MDTLASLQRKSCENVRNFVTSLLQKFCTFCNSLARIINAASNEIVWNILRNQRRRATLACTRKNFTPHDLYKLYCKKRNSSFRDFLSTTVQPLRQNSIRQRLLKYFRCKVAKNSRWQIEVLTTDFNTQRTWRGLRFALFMHHRCCSWSSTHSVIISKLRNCKTMSQSQINSQFNVGYTSASDALWVFARLHYGLGLIQLLIFH